MGIISVISVLVIIFVGFKMNFYLGLAACLLCLCYAIYSYIPIFWAVKAQKAFSDGNFEESKKCFKKSIDTGRAKLNVRINYAYTLMRTGDFDDAERVLDQIIRVKRLKKESFRNSAKQQRCMVYYKQGRLDEALEDAYEMFNGGYKNTQMYGMLGYFKLINNDDINETTSFCEEAYDFNNEDRDITDNLSICYYRQGRYDEAAELSDKIIADSPKFVEAYYHGAQIAAKQGKKEKALELLERVDDCRWSNMTTVTKEDIEALKKSLM